MQSWIIAGSSMAPCACSHFASRMCPVSKASISGRTPRLWMPLAMASSMEGVLTMM